MSPRSMFVWRDAHGVVVADVVQILRGRQVRYVARVPGEQIEKERFSCATRAINEWLARNSIRATPSAT